MDNINSSDTFTTTIEGNLDYSSKKEITIDEGVVVGEVNYSKYSSLASIKENILPCLISLCALLIYVLVIYMATSKFAPKCLEKLSNSFSIKKTLLSFGIGIGLAIGIPVVFAILALSKIGILLGILIALLYVLILILALPTVLIMKSEYLKNKIFKNKLNSYVSLIVITILYWLITLIPYVGPAVALLVVITGTGKLLLSAFKKDCCCNK